MKVTSKEVKYTGKYLRFVEKQFENSGASGSWEGVERTFANKDAVVIIAITREGELLLERNWRVPIESYIIQFPAGLNDKNNESEEEVARRELLEETGYKANELVPLIRTPESPGLLPTGLNHYLALNVEYEGEPDHEIAEMIEVIKVPLHEVKDYLVNLPADTSIDLRVPGLLWYLEIKGILVFSN